MKKANVPIVDVLPTQEYHTEVPVDHVTVDNRLYFTSVPTHKADHTLYYTQQNYDPPRVPLQPDDEPEFIKVSIPTSSLPRSPQRRANTPNQGIAIQNYYDYNFKQGAIVRHPRGEPAGLTNHMSNEEESYFDQTITFSNHKSNLATQDLLDRQAKHRYQLQYLTKIKGPKSPSLRRADDSPYPNL